MSERSRSAVAAAVAVASDAGLVSTAPIVLRDAWHTLVHLAPLPLVARVSVPVTSTGGLDPDGVARELAVAAHAAARGAPVVAPSDLLDPGPYRRDDRIITFWQYVEQAGPVDPAEAGRALRALHVALAEYDGSLPDAAHPQETVRLLELLEPSPDVELLRRAAASAPPAHGQALHGDAHLGNCLAGRDGPLWHDFETATRGPRECDLAALVFRDRVAGYPAARAALAAYGPHDADLVDAWLPPYGAWIVASMLSALDRRPELKPLVRDRLAWLRRVVG